MEKHKCKLCTRTFSNGRALGGHMKAHLATLPLPPKKTELGGGGDSTESASSTSSELEDDNKTREVTLVYGLRNNPKKSFRVADPEFSFAATTSAIVVVQDRESETESSKNPTRKRSKRNRKSFTAIQDQKSNQIKKPKWKKPNCGGGVVLDQSSSSPPPPTTTTTATTDPEPVSSVSDTSPEEDVAICLMMLSRDVWITKQGDQVLEEQEEGAELVKLSKIRGKYRCEKCKKIFRTYHALGGHRRVCEEAAETATVNAVAGKVTTILDEDDKIFKCPFCYRVFGSGQALGGHKRSHLLGPFPSSSSSSSIPIVATTVAAATHSVVKVENTLIDLNLPAPLEEDDYSSVVSDA